MRTLTPLTIDPPGAAWRGVMRQSWERARHDAHAMRTREELGLPTDVPVVMSGHQPGFWHLGVLAKRMALREACDALGCEGAWVVVDQDEVDVGLVRVPVRATDGALRVHDVRLCDAPPSGRPVCAMRAFDPAPRPSLEVHSLGFVRSGLASMVAALREHRTAANAADQTERAAAALARAYIGDAHVFMATALARTTAFGDLVARMLSDPARCATAFNEALRAAPGAGVAELAHDTRRDRWELPLWVIEDGVRRRAWSDEAGSVGVAALAPRALLMTLLLRLGACDLFIHGTGGFVYDRATEAWARSWLGRALAPKACVSATVLLPLRSDGDGVDADDAARAAWLAHHARHNPGAIGDDSFDAKKREALRAIELAKTNGGDAAGAYKELHALLEEHRLANAPSLRALDERAAAARLRAREAAVVNDRTYAFPLHGEKALERLREEIRAVFLGV